jgi:hypothetical protein
VAGRAPKESRLPVETKKLDFHRLRGVFRSQIVKAGGESPRAAAERAPLTDVGGHTAPLPIIAEVWPVP